MRMFFWVLTIIGSVIGGFFMVDALLVSTSAPQQGAAAAVAVGFAVLPYVFARACDQIVAIKREAAALDANWKSRLIAGPPAQSSPIVHPEPGSGMSGS